MSRSIPVKTTQIFHGTKEFSCPYLDGKIERKVITELCEPDAEELYDSLSIAGFRRSHNVAYRPACPDCNACVPVRIEVNNFFWTKSFKRTLKRNNDLFSMNLEARATLEQYHLFQTYQQSRHSGGEMENMRYIDYKAMIEQSPIETHTIEFRQKHNQKLVAVLLADYQSDSVSAVYSFYDITNSERSLGTYMVLWTVKLAKFLNKKFVYLGYWVEKSPKMAYKTRFKPLEGLGPKGWEIINL
ncbi:MAG: arginyltransferase [Rhodospirillaceae bacterium]|nr:arginyltransferase [Rhodospirillaceae bacterium]|tara:strand:- start:5045 stop:5773 length:729 start_codon:yes stop_codon:yes gene_type:complete